MSNFMPPGILNNLFENQPSKFQRQYLVTQLPNYKEQMRTKRNKLSYFKNN